MTAPALAIPDGVVDEAVPFPMIDPTRNQLMLSVGRKGSGKSVWAREAFRHWPGVDRFVIDPTGDAIPGSPRRQGDPSSWTDDLGTVTLNKLPRELPPGPLRDGKRQHGVWRWVANPQSATYADDLDRAVGLGLFPRSRRMLLWIDEAGEVFPSGRTGPHGRTLLQQSRHWHTSALICCPRPVTIDPLVLAQADRVVMFDVPGVADRKRLADTLGWPHAQLVALLNEVRMLPFHYLMYVASEHKMYLCPPIPVT
jgi:hypothetical protein